MNNISSPKSIKILAIESSCDETAASVLEAISHKLQITKVSIISNIVSSQVKLHSKYGGVYPELASREHVKNIIPVLEQALGKNHKSKILNLKSEIDYLAVTTTPGLIGSLLVGVNTTKTLSFTKDIPIIPVNHLEGHIYANFIDENPKFPLLALVVSGGHTSLIYMKDHMSYKIIGETIDDAAGEAYDKVAKMLGLGYPGGPIIDALASKLQATSYKLQDLFPRPLINKDNFNFSFSGLKTSVLYYVKDKKITKDLQVKVAYEFQEAVTDVLVAKTIKAAQKYKVRSVILGGGVAANSRLREKIKSQISNLKFEIDLHIPSIRYCTDNAAVIGTAAAYKLLKEKPHEWYDIEAKANSEL